MADPLLRRYVERLMREEIAPLLEPAPGIDLDAYRRTLVRRLADPMVRDQLARLCRRGSAKVPAHLLPTIVEAQRTGRPHTLATLAVAAWLRYLRGTDLHGREIPVADPRWPELRALAVDGGDDPAPLMRASGLFGSLADDPQAVADIGGALHDVERAGLRAALIARLDGDGRA
jgi:fructuronate reductase/mannitol 2-dehydrogenase